MDVYTKDVLTHEYNRQYAQAIRNRAARGPINEHTLVWAHLVAGTITRRQDLVDAMYTAAQDAMGVDDADLAMLLAEQATAYLLKHQAPISDWHPCDHELCQPNPSHEAINCASYAYAD